MASTQSVIDHSPALRVHEHVCRDETVGRAARGVRGARPGPVSCFEWWGRSIVPRRPMSSPPERAGLLARCYDRVMNRGVERAEMAEVIGRDRDLDAIRTLLVSSDGAGAI